MRVKLSFVLPDRELTIEERQVIEQLKDTLRGYSTISNEPEELDDILFDVTLQTRTGHRVHNSLFNYLIVNKQLPGILEVSGDTIKTTRVIFEDNTEVGLEDSPQEVFGYGTSSEEAWKKALDFLLSF